MNLRYQNIQQPITTIHPKTLIFYLPPRYLTRTSHKANPEKKTREKSPRMHRSHVRRPYRDKTVKIRPTLRPDYYSNVIRLRRISSGRRKSESGQWGLSPRRGPQKRGPSPKVGAEPLLLADKHLAQSKDTRRWRFTCFRTAALGHSAFLFSLLLLFILSMKILNENSIWLILVIILTIGNLFIRFAIR